MKLEEQVVSLELAKRLKELGVKQESIFFWNVGHWDEPQLIAPSFMGSTGILPSGENYSAFTVAELVEARAACLIEQYGHDFGTVENTKADGRAETLIYLI